MSQCQALENLHFSHATRKKYYGNEKGLGFSRLNNINIIETIFFTSLSDGRSVIDLSIDMDVMPALKKLTDRNVFEKTNMPEKNLKRFENNCNYRDIRCIQSVGLLDNGYCLSGSSLEEATTIFFCSKDVPESAKNDIYEKCLPWFASRDSREKVISLIINDDQILVSEQRKRVTEKERSKSLLSRILFKQNNTPTYRSVISGYGAYPVLASLYFDIGEIETARDYVHRYWLEMFKL